MNLKEYIAKLTFQIGDLIHYQEHDYRPEFPKNADIYNNMGTILRFLGGKEGREFFTVQDLLEENSTIRDMIPKDVIDAVKPFNSIMIVELVSRMQGKPEDGTFFEIAEFVKYMHKNPTHN
ncbi:hypothetical protein [Aquimarina mytili]|uniref:Uncharacterized protein n=1 Tax=Aquimarina mytili TaxID=874423 RepID=A0A936ZXD0_9FLAO|nr:hypothetical protein [Aquimarina mytili]MBL0686047.1 hypothetical protein [Aquimarina mytili]